MWVFFTWILRELLEEKRFHYSIFCEYGAYFYNKGTFSQGYAKEHSVTSISKEEINDLLKNYNFECALKWK